MDNSTTANGKTGPGSNEAHQKSNDTEEIKSGSKNKDVYKITIDRSKANEALIGIDFDQPTNSERANLDEKLGVILRSDDDWNMSWTS